MSVIGVGIALFLGCILQCITGMGLALVAAPLLILFLGEHDGVMLLQVIGVIVCAVSAKALWHEIDRPKLIRIFIPAAIGVIPGVVFAHLVAPKILDISLGVATLIALALGKLVTHSRLMAGPAGAPIAGGTSGFLNVCAGIGGPPLVIYAHCINWEYRSYVATAQAYFTCLNLLSLIMSLISHGIPVFQNGIWITAATTSIAGFIAAHYLHDYLPEKRAGQLVYIIAVLGAAAVTVRGIL
ncbi:MAG: sulfite exporter TauE/SafE family protein [Corynebacterium sp.]|nr:sulfite exporter TauE/SafE family protein [Corynebacterium sp.]